MLYSILRFHHLFLYSSFNCFTVNCFNSFSIICNVAAHNSGDCCWITGIVGSWGCWGSLAFASACLINASRSSSSDALCTSGGSGDAWFGSSSNEGGTISSSGSRTGVHVNSTVVPCCCCCWMLL